jgi:elongator complex protein 4
VSSFRRRQTVASLPGTRPSPSGAPLLSTGLPSIDDLLGGGLPVSSLLLIESDFPTSYSDLLLKYWVAQGLECGQEVAVVAAGVEGGPEGICETLMGLDGGGERKETKEEVEERENEERLKEKMKIAFRYEGMKQHQVSLDEGKGAFFSSLSLFDWC